MSTYQRAADLPNFENPPVVEVVLSIQFDPIVHLQTVQIGLLWAKFRREFPKVEERGPLNPVVERFGAPASPKIGVRFEAREIPPLARVLFLNAPENQLVQVQPDRFIHNWRKTTGMGEYPRYGTIREAFLREVDLFEQFLTEEALGELCINQCEVTYINHIVADSAWRGHGDADKIFDLVRTPSTGTFLPQPEDVSMQARYQISVRDRKPIGRLHVSIQPGWRKPDNTPIYILELTARGAPVGTSIEGARSFFDIGHDWIVRGFKDITAPTMHDLWRLTNG